MHPNREGNIIHRDRTHRLRRLSLTLALPAALLVGLIALAGGASAMVGSTTLTITKTASVSSVVQGGSITYTITVANPSAGVNDASNVVVTDPLPSQVDYTSSTGGCTNGNGNQKDTVTCNLGTLLSGGSTAVTITAKTSSSGTASNTATVTSPDATTKTATATTTVTKPPTTPGKGKGKKKGKASCASPTIVGTPGNDTLVGTRKADIIAPLGGNDVVFGGGGNDAICASTGADRLFGGAGSDSLAGGRGRDRLFGGAGNDFLNGGRGHDKCRGGPGTDVKKSCP
jgi:uncharacterized repeat protein (TIGR01451 family)